jgi:hypothetical protein
MDTVSPHLKKLKNLNNSVSTTGHRSEIWTRYLLNMKRVLTMPSSCCMECYFFYEPYKRKGVLSFHLIDSELFWLTKTVCNKLTCFHLVSTCFTAHWPHVQVIHIVTCGSNARECVEKHFSMEMDSWKPTRYGTRFRVNEWSTNISLDTDTLYKRPFRYGPSQSQ